MNWNPLCTLTSQPFFCKCFSWTLKTHKYLQRLMPNTSWSWIIWEATWFGFVKRMRLVPVCIIVPKTSFLLYVIPVLKFGFWCTLWRRHRAISTSHKKPWKKCYAIIFQTMQRKKNTLPPQASLTNLKKTMGSKSFFSEISFLIKHLEKCKCCNFRQDCKVCAGALPTFF